MIWLYIYHNTFYIRYWWDLNEIKECKIWKECKRSISATWKEKNCNKETGSTRKQTGNQPFSCVDTQNMIKVVLTEV